MCFFFNARLVASDEASDPIDFRNHQLLGFHPNGEYGVTIDLKYYLVTLITSRSFKCKEIFEARLDEFFIVRPDWPNCFFTQIIFIGN